MHKYQLGKIVLILLLITFHIYQKTFRVNILPIIHSRVNNSEVKAALLVKKLSNTNDIPLRLDFSYPVMIYYSDRNFDYYVNMDEDLYQKILRQKIRWMSGKSDRIDEFMEKFGDRFNSNRYTVDDESLLHILSFKIPLDNHRQ